MKKHFCAYLIMRNEVQRKSNRKYINHVGNLRFRSYKHIDWEISTVL